MGVTIAVDRGGLEALQRLPKGGLELIETEGLPTRIWDPGVFHGKPFMKVASK